jgi:hypothetical protein
MKGLIEKLEKTMIRILTFLISAPFIFIFKRLSKKGK